MKTRVNRKTAKTIKNKKTRKLRQKGGGQSCYKLDKNGKNFKTWSCAAACGEDGACQTYD